MSRFLVWRGTDAWRAEAASVDLGDDGVRARGTQLGADPVPYRLDYDLDVGAGWVTRRLQVTAAGEGWRRSLDLRSDGAGAWACTAQEEGEVDLPPAGGETDALAGALDCDLGLSPLTNLMPVRRHELHRREGEVDFLMAWVSAPGLSVHPSRQRYEHVSTDGAGATVRYVGEHRSFVAELTLDTDGLVVVYPQLCRRVG